MIHENINTYRQNPEDEVIKDDIIEVSELMLNTHGHIADAVANQIQQSDSDRIPYAKEGEISPVDALRGIGGAILTLCTVADPGKLAAQEYTRLELSEEERVARERSHSKLAA